MPCKNFARAVKEDAQLKKALEDLVLLMLDVATPEGKDLAEIFNVRAFPTFALLNANGETLYSWIGYGRPDGWIETLFGALADPITVTERQDRYRSTPSFRDALTLGNISHHQGQYQEAESYYRQAQILDAQAALQADVPLLIFRSVFRGVGVGQFTTEQAGAHIEELLGADDVRPEYALEVVESLTGVRDQIGDEIITPYLKMAYPFVQAIDDPELEQRKNNALAEYALIIEKDSEKAAELKRASLPSGWESDPGSLNEFAWWCFENTVNLEEAEILSRRSIELSQPGAEQANYLDTLAELINLRGDTAGAIELTQRALQMNPESGYLNNQLVRFQDILEKKKLQEPSS